MIFLFDEYQKNRRITNSLCVDEKDYLFNFLLRNKSEPIDKTIINKLGRPVCSVCGEQMMKNGKKGSHQKRICRVCRKTCLTNSGHSTSYSKTNAYVWYNFLKCEKSHFSLRKTADICKISLQTAFYTRHKFQNILVDEMDKIKLEGRIEVDGFEYKINFKGTKPCNMPRASKKEELQTVRKPKK